MVSDKIHSFLSSDSTGRVCSHFFDSVIRNIPSSGLQIPICSWKRSTRCSQFIRKVNSFIPNHQPRQEAQPLHKGINYKHSRDSFFLISHESLSISLGRMSYIDYLLVENQIPFRHGMTSSFRLRLERTAYRKSHTSRTPSSHSTSAAWFLNRSPLLSVQIRFFALCLHYLFLWIFTPYSTISTSSIPSNVITKPKSHYQRGFCAYYQSFDWSFQALLINIRVSKLNKK